MGWSEEEKTARLWKQVEGDNPMRKSCRELKKRPLRGLDEPAHPRPESWKPKEIPATWSAGARGEKPGACKYVRLCSCWFDVYVIGYHYVYVYVYVLLVFVFLFVFLFVPVYVRVYVRVRVYDYDCVFVFYVYVLKDYVHVLCFMFCVSDYVIQRSANEAQS